MGQLEDMSMFIRIVNAGGISRAADQLGIAKSAVSRRLVDLETRLGVRLLNRTTRTSSLTEIGQNYYNHAITIVEDVAELNAITGDANTSLKGTINIAVPLSFGIRHLSPAISDFLTLHPELIVNIDFSDRVVDLVEEGLDLAFRIASLKDSSLIARKISPIKIVLCASPKYLEQYGTPKIAKELNHHKLLHYNITNSNTWKLVDKKGIAHNINIKANVLANNGDFLKDMAIAGHGIVSSPTFIIWEAITRGELVPILTNYQLPQPNAYAVYPQTRYLSQRTRVLIDFLIDRFGDEPYWDKCITF